VSDEVIYCGICKKEIFRHSAEPVVSRGRTSSRAPSAQSAALLTEMMIDAENAHQQMLARAEQACTEHFQERHALRLRLWKRMQWKWLMQQRWPWGGHKGAEKFDWRPSR
jgi:hypothetical protein